MLFNMFFTLTINISHPIFITTNTTFFNLSMAEVGLGAKNNNVAEGTVLPFYTGATNADRIKYDITAATTARGWWLRSPNPSSANYVRGVYTSGALNYIIAYNGNGLAPACIEGPSFE